MKLLAVMGILSMKISAVNAPCAWNDAGPGTVSQRFGGGTHFGKSASEISDWRQRRVIDPWAMHRGGYTCRDRTSEVLKVAVGLGMILDRGVFSAGGAGFVHRRADGSIFRAPKKVREKKLMRRVCQFVGPDKASRATPHRAPPPRSRRMPAVDFWDHPPDPPSAASVDGVASPAPRVVLVPVDDSDHAQRAVAWACDNLLRGGDGGDVAHLLHVVPAVHAATAMAYGGPPVWMEDLSTFSKSLYAVTAIPPAAISYIVSTALSSRTLFLGRSRRGFLSFATKTR